MKKLKLIVPNVRLIACLLLHRNFGNTLKFIRPIANTLFGCHNLKGIKYSTWLRLGLSHLCEHKFKNIFQDTLNPLCTCGCEVKNTCHFLLYCPNFFTERNTLLSKLLILIVIF